MKRSKRKMKPCSMVCTTGKLLTFMGVVGGGVAASVVLSKNLGSYCFNQTSNMVAGLSQLKTISIEVSLSSIVSMIGILLPEPLRPVLNAIVSNGIPMDIALPDDLLNSLTKFQHDLPQTAETICQTAALGAGLVSTLALSASVLAIIALINVCQARGDLEKDLEPNDIELTEVVVGPGLRP